MDKEKKRGKKRGVFFQHYNTQKRTQHQKDVTRKNTSTFIQSRARARSPVKRVDTAEQKAERENENKRERERKNDDDEMDFGEPWRFQSGRFPLKKMQRRFDVQEIFFPLSARTNDEGSRYGFALLRSSKAVEVGVAMALLCVSVVVVLVAVAGVKILCREEGREGQDGDEGERERFVDDEGGGGDRWNAKRRKKKIKNEGNTRNSLYGAIV